MSINFSNFDQSALSILRKLAVNFPTPTEVGFNDVFPDIEATTALLAKHIGTLAFLKHEDIIVHEVSSVSSFILTAKGLSLFSENAIEHLKILLDE